MRPGIFLLCVVGLLAYTPSLSSRDYYVDNVAGDDRNDGSPVDSGSANAGPFRTIGKALRVATRGDQIILKNAGQPYYESITLQGVTNSGTKYIPFRIIGNGAQLDGTLPVPEDSWEHVKGNLFRFRPTWLSHQQMYRNGRPLEKVTAEGPEHPALEPMQWALHNQWVYFQTERAKLPTDYDLRHCGQRVGITLYQVANVAIEDLVVQGFQLDGINAHDLAFNIEIVGNTLRGNGRSGVSVGGSSQVTLQACLIGDNGSAQVRTEGFCRVAIENCDIIDAQGFGPPIVREGGRVTVDGSPSQ